MYTQRYCVALFNLLFLVHHTAQNSVVCTIQLVLHILIVLMLLGLVDDTTPFPMFSTWPGQLSCECGIKETLLYPLTPAVKYLE